MSIRCAILLLPAMVIAGCPERVKHPDLATIGLQVEPSILKHCCNPFEPAPAAPGYYVGQITVVNTGSPIAVKVLEAFDDQDTPPTLDFFHDGKQIITALELAQGANTVTVYSRSCVTTPRTVLIQHDLQDGRKAQGWFDVVWECPDKDLPSPLATFYALCGPSAVPDFLAITSRASPEGALAGPSGIFGAGEEFVLAGVGGGSCCTSDGTALQSVVSLDFLAGRALPEVAGKASAAILFYGNSTTAFSAWVEANNAFGMISLGGGFDNWTDAAPSGDEAATDQVLLVGNAGSRIRPVVPLELVPQWGLGSFDIVPPSGFDPAWGRPVTAARPERYGDILVACETSLSDAGNLVLISMGGDDAADSSALVGQSGEQPRRLRGKDGVYGVTCFGENLLSLFRRTATGFEKIGDAVVGDGPLDLDAKRLANGRVAFLCTGSRDDTWSVVIVDPATGAIASRMTKPVPAGLEGPTSGVWAAGGDVYLLGRTSRNIVRFDSGVK
jgi:hypothetical protein